MIRILQVLTAALLSLAIVGPPPTSTAAPTSAVVSAQQAKPPAPEVQGTYIWCTGDAGAYVETDQIVNADGKRIGTWAHCTDVAPPKGYNGVMLHKAARYCLAKTSAGKLAHTSKQCRAKLRTALTKR